MKKYLPIIPTHINQVLTFSNLFKSFHKCKPGVAWKESVSSFSLNAPQRVFNLYTQLKKGIYKEKPQKHFMVYRPKEREIVSINFTDRVYQRCLADFGVYDSLQKHFIYDNAACQKGKGTDFARNRLVAFMQKHFRKVKNEGYILKCDIRHYYPEMQHSVAKETFKKYLSPSIYKCAKTILDSYAGEIGYNPGSQMIQLVGISVLDKLDHYCKEKLRIKYYIRYMDDIIILCDSKEDAKNYLKKIKDFLNKLLFKLNYKKTYIYEFSRGVEFLGFHFRLSNTGKLIKIPNTKRIKDEKRRLQHMIDNQNIPDWKIIECFKCWKAHVSKSKSYFKTQSVSKWVYNKLKHRDKEN